MCIPPPCVRTSVQLSSNAANRQGLHYACPGDELTFTCQVFNGAGLQWVNEPKICRSLPVGYTTANREGEMQSGSFYQSYLISVVRNPPFSNFSSNLTFTANASNVTVQCGDQLSSCSDTEAESSIIITGKCDLINLVYFLNKIRSYTPRCEIKNPHNITKLIHRPEEGLNLKYECILVSAMVHLAQE